jgi:hypothetical protein
MPCGCCLLAVAGSLVPRLTVLFLWLFTDLVQDAFDGWILPLVGLIFLPFTTLMYVVAYWFSDGSITWAWVLIVIAFFVDLGNYGSGAYGRGKTVTMPGTSG